MPSDVEEIKQRLNIEDVIAEYVQLKKAGANFRAVCPFHQEKTPSFMVSPSKQIWHCFGCGRGGDVFEFIKESEGVEFPEALEMLAARAGLTLSRKPGINYQAEKDKKTKLYEINRLATTFFNKVLESSAGAGIARDYVGNRELSPETVKSWQLGFSLDDFHVLENFLVKKGYQKSELLAAGVLAEKEGNYFDRFRGRLMFPLFDLHGRVAGFTGRILVEQDGVGKYVNSPETEIYNKSELLYGLNFAKQDIKKANEVVVVEGNTDVISLHQAGFKNVVASSGTALTKAQLLILKRFTENLNFAFDVDDAGLRATRRAVELALAEGFNVKIIKIPSELATDPDELVRKDPNAWQTQVSQAESFLDYYFHQQLEDLDLNSSVSKKQVAKDLLSLIVLLPDPMDRSHYVQRLSRELQIDERIVLEVLNRVSQKKRDQTAGAKERTGLSVRKTKRQLFEERVLGLLLKFSQIRESILDSLAPVDFSNHNLRSIYSMIVDQLKSNKQLNIEEVKLTNPKLADEIDLLIFGLENELQTMPEMTTDELRKEFVNSFKVELLREKMKSLSGQIGLAESSGQKSRLEDLSNQFHQVSQELTKYQAK